MAKNHFKAWTNDEDIYLDANYAHTDNAALAKKLGRSRESVIARAQILGLKKAKAEYAFYQGDNVVGVGTLDELSKQTGIVKGALLKYGTPSYRKVSKNGRNLVKI